MSSGIILDLIVVILILIFMAIGSKKGLTVCIVNVFSLIIALICALIFCKPIGNMIIKNTNIDDNINNTIYQNLNINIGEEIDVNNSNLPESMKKYIIETMNNANQTKEEAIKKISNEISTQIVYIIAFVGIFVAVRILLVVLKILSNIINKLPVLSQIDKLGGAVCGLIEGMIVIYTALTIISMVSPTIKNEKFSNCIENSIIAKQIYNNNLISKKVFKY